MLTQPYPDGVMTGLLFVSRLGHKGVTVSRLARNHTCPRCLSITLPLGHRYLDTVLSSDKKLAATSAHLATGQVSKGKSRKWMRQAAKSFKIQAVADESNEWRMSTVSTASTTMDDSSAEDDDDLDDLEADDEFFNALEKKRQERAKEQESRRVSHPPDVLVGAQPPVITPALDLPYYYPYSPSSF